MRAQSPVMFCRRFSTLNVVVSHNLFFVCLLFFLIRVSAVGEVELPLCDVLLVGGGSSAGCTSSIADLNSGLFVQQLLPPPITDTPDTPDFEAKGNINDDDSLTYVHKPAKVGRGFGLIQMKTVPDADGGRGVIDCEVYIAEETYDKYVLANKMMRLPMWVENTLKEAYATEILDDGSDDDGEGGEKEQKDGEEGDEDVRNHSSTNENCYKTLNPGPCEAITEEEFISGLLA